MAKLLRWLLAAAIAISIPVTANAFLPLGPTGKQTPTYVISRKRWDGNLNNFWLKRLPSSLEGLRFQLWEISQPNPAGGQDGLIDEFMRLPSRFHELVRLLETLCAMDVALRHASARSPGLPSWLEGKREVLAEEAKQAAYSLGIEPWHLTSAITSTVDMFVKTRRADVFPLIGMLSYFDAPNAFDAPDAPNQSVARRLHGFVLRSGVEGVPRPDLERQRSDPSYTFELELIAFVRSRPEFKYGDSIPEFASDYVPPADEPGEGAPVRIAFSRWVVVYTVIIAAAVILLLWVSISAMRNVRH